MKNSEKLKLMKQGYFFHPGGDMFPEKMNPKTRGIWKKSEKNSHFIGISWADARLDSERSRGI